MYFNFLYVVLSCLTSSLLVLLLSEWKVKREEEMHFHCFVGCSFCEVLLFLLLLMLLTPPSQSLPLSYLFTHCTPHYHSLTLFLSHSSSIPHPLPHSSSHPTLPPSLSLSMSCLVLSCLVLSYTSNKTQNDFILSSFILYLICFSFILSHFMMSYFNSYFLFCLISFCPVQIHFYLIFHVVKEKWKVKITTI